MAIQQNMRNRDKDSDKFKSYEDFDLLELSDTKDRIFRVIESVTPPLTIGLYGEWGSGKTEMIHGIIDDLDEDKNKYLTLYFDAWEYRKEDNISLAILSKMHNEFLKDIGYEVKRKTVSIVKSLAYVGANAFTKATTGGLVSIEDIEKGLEISEKDCKDYILYVNEVEKLKTNYKELIDTILEKTQKEKIFIFVDNLDRCLPDIVVNLLENISIFLSYQGVNCVYTLAMDKEHVVKAVKHLYKDFEGDKYLEKIIHLSLNIPAGEGAMKSFEEVYKLARGITKHNPKGFEGNVQSTFDFNYSDFDYLRDLFDKGILSVPRRINKVVHQLIVFEKYMQTIDIQKKVSFYTVLFFIIFKEFFYVTYLSLDWVKDIEDIDYLFTIANIIRPHQINSATSLRSTQNDIKNHLKNMQNIFLANEMLNNDEFRCFIRNFGSLFKSDNYDTQYFTNACAIILEEIGAI